MKRIVIQNILDGLENKIWDINYWLMSVNNLPQKRILLKNRKFRNKYKGQACFIVGNGPSLKLERNLQELAKYTVFTVNQMYRSELYNVLQPNFHVMIDPLFFQLDEKDPAEAETLNCIRKIVKTKSTQMIFPLEAYEYIKTNIGNPDEFLYIKNRMRLSENYSRSFEMEKYLPCTRNVVLSAIYCAISMGFQQITLLGCDMTGWTDNYIKRSPNLEEKFSHIYEYTDNERVRMSRVHKAFSNEEMLTGFASMFRDFRIVSKWCEKNGIIFTNATQETALDCVPFSTLDDVLMHLSSGL